MTRSAARPSDPLRDLDRVLVHEAAAVEDFLSYHRNQVLCPIYASVDIRRNATKAAVVDANAFPAGFNNLSKRSGKDAVEAVQGYMERVYPQARSVLILAESHTRNAWYFESLCALGDLFERAGLAVTLGTMAKELFPQTRVTTARGHPLTLHGVTREGDALMADGDVQDVVVLNNDLSEGRPGLVADLSQPVTPPPGMGWHQRRKSRHFRIVEELAGQLGKHAGFDPWLLTARFRRVEGVDFGNEAGLEAIAAAADEVLGEVRSKYEEYGIHGEPTAFVKADAGTYGMAVTSVASGAEFLRLNARGRRRMAVGKGGVRTTSVIVQEGVPTDLAISGGGAAEPVMYMVCGRVVGGFLRVHAERGPRENLNAPGSSFRPLAFATQLAGEPGHDEVVLDATSRHAFQVLAEVASIATGYECRFLETGGRDVPRYP